MAWQTATVYFAVIELVAAVGLWLATPWGAVVWLTTVVSMAVIELMFPGIYGGSLVVVAVEARDARGLSGAGLDGRARTAAIAIAVLSYRASRRKYRRHGAADRAIFEPGNDLRKSGGRYKILAIFSR